MQPFIVVLASYLIGSIPTSFVAGKLRGIDLSAHGSGNLGATNAFRVLGPGTGTAVLAIDVLKGVAAVALIAPALSGNGPLGPVGTGVLAGIAAIAGHIWPVFGRFKGGKGVATACGVFLALLPIATLVSIGVWLVVALSTRYVSVASMAAAVALPVAAIIQLRRADAPQPAILIAMTIAIAVVVVVMHRSNMRRLLAGTEGRFGKRQDHEAESGKAEARGEVR